MAAKQRFIVIGLGAFGREIAQTLKDNEAELIVMDSNPSVVNQMKQAGFEFTVQVDNTDPIAMANFIQSDDVVILSLGEAFEANLLTIEILKELGVKRIYARATKDIQVKILDRMNISQILYPEKQEGKRFALQLLNKDVKFLDELALDVFISEIDIPEKFIGKTIPDLKIRTLFGVNIIGIKHKTLLQDGKQVTRMDPVGFENTVLTEGHSLVVIGKEEDIKKLASE
jgi:trk system potassium uptake protein TrkA